MVKFTKVGLTESILENSPPKTLLYKIKLQLRSIKSSSISEEKEKEKEIIKSMIDINAGQNTLYEEEKIKELPQTNAEATPEEDKKVSLEADAENAIHYASNYKGKMSPQEETIDTHWKTQRKTTEVTLDLFEGEKKKDFERNHDDIDLYYRGIAKKNNNFTIEEEDIYSKKKTLSNEESTSIRQKQRRKQRQKQRQNHVQKQRQRQQTHQLLQKQLQQKQLPRKHHHFNLHV